MADKVPPMFDGNLPVGAREVQVPLIELAGCQIRTGADPNDPRRKAIIIGPVVFSIPLDSEPARIVVRGLTGIEIAGPAAVPPEQES